MREEIHIAAVSLNSGHRGFPRLDFRCSPVNNRAYGFPRMLMFNHTTMVQSFQLLDNNSTLPFYVQLSWLSIKTVFIGYIVIFFVHCSVK